MSEAKPATPETLDHLTCASRERIQAALDNMRDGGYALASLCLAAHRQVHTNHTDASEALALVLGKNLELASLANSIARELNR